MDKNKRLRTLPKVDEMMALISPELVENVPSNLVKEIVQAEIQMQRQRILSDPSYTFSLELFQKQMIDVVRRQGAPHLKRVINGTGVILHTNLGRAKLAKSVAKQMSHLSEGYSNLEYDLDGGQRGSRYEHVESLLTSLTGAEAALVVNNNAAAVYLILNSLAQGKEVIVSRGELVEIGGSFRIPEIMTASGCRLVEVGTTNKTHPEDYQNHISEETGALLKVHTSNYKLVGFTKEVLVSQLKEIGAKKEIPVIYDLGSGLLADLSEYGIHSEPTVKQSVKEQADILCFSGDKLLGGPQAGIIVGKAKYIEKMKKNHLLRALRIDKLTLSALELTLRIYASPNQAVKEIPTLHMISSSLADLKEKAKSFLKQLKEGPNCSYEIVATKGTVGGGTMPGVELDSYAIAVSANSVSTEKLETMLRGCEIPIIVRILHDRILFDVRTMEAEEITIVAEYLNHFNLKGVFQ